GRAIMEFHARSQLKSPSLEVVRVRPRNRELRNGLPAIIQGRQRVKDKRRGHLRRGIEDSHLDWIKPRYIQLKANGDAAASVLRKSWIDKKRCAEGRQHQCKKSLLITNLCCHGPFLPWTSVRQVDGSALGITADLIRPAALVNATLVRIASLVKLRSELIGR